MNPPASHPVLTCAEAKAWEQRLLPDADAEWSAMQAAGAQISAAVIGDLGEIGGLPDQARVLVLVGKGHNGGDALLAARSLLAKFPRATVEILLCLGETLLRPLAHRALDELRLGAGTRCRVVTMDHLRADPAGFDLCLDGIFGFQFRLPIEERTGEILAWVNRHPDIRLRAAVDLPSGVGEANASTVFRADFTYATGIVKEPLLLAVNAAAVGRLRYLDLGFFPDELAVPGAPNRILLSSILGPLAVLRPTQSDKRTYGHLCVVGGSHSYPGAVILAVRAALRSGVGLVTAFVPEFLAAQCASQHPEVMWVGCPTNNSGGMAPGSLRLMREPMKRATALLIGPGLGADAETLELVRHLVADSGGPLVLDADALRPEIVREVQTQTFICTPHAGEFKRIAPALYDGGQFKAASGVLVLKGALTSVTDGRISYHSPFGGPVLARGGSGDMLAGLVGGLLAQSPAAPLLAACRGVVWHGLAADLLARTHGQVAVENSQLLEQLGPALTQIHGRLIDGAAGVHGPERSA